ncbi:MAG: ATP-dependent helicase DeaD [Clostridia bacterium]|jgi:ATP-dependent RNA helicase DeaD|nr:ATP-dependent helicase DeaD [Clostridia bacterium]
MLTFRELEINEKIMIAIEEMGFEQATPIQEQAIPVALQGRDIIGQAQTGTGKTAAFTIPFLELINNEPVIQVLVLTPTRELCIQVAEEVGKIGKYINLKALPIYGGQDINRQIRALKGRPQIIIATPGRLMDHMQRKTIRLNNLKMVVLDEADEMLNMGFLEDIENILAVCPEERQTMMFSATMRSEIENIANKFMRDPVLVKVKAQELTVPNIEQHFYEVPERQKLDALCRLLDVHTPELTLVFGRTKRRVDELSDALQKRGYLAEGIHGDLNQRQRDTVMGKFRTGLIEILVATDVAARGLDITGVTHVYNFDIPLDVDSYVHRIGRTGRAGQRGLAITFVEPREFGQLRNIERTIRRKLQRKQLPTLADVKREKQKMTAGKIVAIIEDGKYGEYKYLAEQLINDYDSLTVLSAALKLLEGTEEDKKDDIKLTEEKPVIIKKKRKPGGYNRKNRAKRSMK